MAFFAYRWWRRRYSLEYRLRYGSGFTDGLGPGQPRLKETVQPPNKTESTIINEMMTAAYAAEDGQDPRASAGQTNWPSHDQNYDYYLDEKQQIPLRPPSVAARTEVTAAPTADGELLSLYARTSRGLSWFYKGGRYQPRQDLENLGNGVEITNPVAGRLGSVPQPPQPSVASRRSPVVSMAVTSKTSESSATESTWKSWGGGSGTSGKRGFVERWLHKG
ncbi:hypothetical protein GQ53DRAFT_286399 [Thozetella sp. PMI_491]|nr:hypothetical protein GQ53DRAFT_286399 [Thozetella sp. PMI_491]